MRGLKGKVSIVTRAVLQGSVMLVSNACVPRGGKFFLLVEAIMELIQKQSCDEKDMKQLFYREIWARKSFVLKQLKKR